MKIRDLIERDLADEPQSVVKVYETAKLKVDFEEYVLTDHLARDFAKVLEPIVESATPASGGTSNVGVWISGFFGSGKSHFAKVLGHLVADSPIDGSTARTLFKRHLRAGQPGDEAAAEWLQQAQTHAFDTTLVAFDIATTYATDDAGNVGRTFLRKLYEARDLSKVIPFAQRELELQRNGQYEDFLKLYEKKIGRPWGEDKHLASSVSDLALCLADLLPERHTSQEAAIQALNFDLDHLRSMSIEDVVKSMLRWLDDVEGDAKNPVRLIFVADEIGAWCGRDRNRIEQIRAFVEELGVLGQGRIWLVATSQERLSEVVANAPDQDEATARDLQQRLEARFRVNVHLESSEVGTVIEDRVLKKKPDARPELEELCTRYQAQLAGIGESPGVEVGGNYPGPDMENFIKDYPFLPYQIPASADLFGSMRGPKVSSGARTMIEVVFDSIKELADEDLGRIVSWDQIFDSANNDNEFQDEQYLGSQGLNYLLAADQHVDDTPIRPSRVLKVLWLIQQSQRIPRTVANVARLLVRDLEDDVLRIEQDLELTLKKLEDRPEPYVRFEASTEQWRFLTQDQVTVEKIVNRITGELRERDIRREREELFATKLLEIVNGRMNHGRSATPFKYGIFFGDAPLKYESEPVALKVSLEGTQAAEDAVANHAVDLEDPIVYWVAASPDKLDTRLKRALAIERLQSDDEFRRVATQRTKAEAKELAIEADTLRADAAVEVLKALESGELLWAGQRKRVGAARSGHASLSQMKAEVEGALGDRIHTKFSRFQEGDHAVKEKSIEKLLTAAPSDRQGLDPELGFFDAQGELLPDHPVVREVIKHLTTQTRNSGKDLIESFADPPYGWPSDVVRYAVASLFIANRLFAQDPSGRAIDDPRTAVAKSVFGTGPFKSHRFEMEEEPLAVEERRSARDLLAELGTPPANEGELELKDATVRALADLSKLSSNVDKAREAELRLPPIYGEIDAILEELQEEASRTKLIRALLGHAPKLMEIKRSLDSLTRFVKHNGLAQYARSQELVAQAVAAGLSEDPKVGDTIREAASQYEAIKDQYRVLDEWEGAFADYRSKVVEAYSSVYLPLRQEVVRKGDEARSSITSMEEYERLDAANRSRIKDEFFAEGRGLAEIRVLELHGDDQLVTATRQVSIPYLRQTLAALPTQVGLAKSRVLELLAEQDGADRIEIWNPEHALAGTQFTTEEEVDMVFDEAKKEVKALIREGKIVRIL